VAAWSCREVVGDGDGDRLPAMGKWTEMVASIRFSGATSGVLWRAPGHCVVRGDRGSDGETGRDGGARLGLVRMLRNGMECCPFHVDWPGME
jgi:hypothetical protein